MAAPREEASKEAIERNPGCQRRFGSAAPQEEQSKEATERKPGCHQGPACDEKICRSCGEEAVSPGSEGACRGAECQLTRPAHKRQAGMSNSTQSNISVEPISAGGDLMELLCKVDMCEVFSPPRVGPKL